MKIKVGPRRSGSALLLALVAFLFMAGVGGAIFSLTLAGQRTTMNASYGDQAFHIAEAGIDDVINKMRRLNAAPNVTGADYQILTVEDKDWDGTPANIIKGELHGGGRFWVAVVPPFVPNKYGSYTITSVGTVGGVIRGLTAYVACEEQSSLFRTALFGDVYLDAGGNVKTDGYNAALDSYADHTKTEFNGVMVAKQSGHVGSNGNVDVSGSSTIYGNATPGPTATVTGGGKVAGSTEPAKEATPLNPPDFTIPSGTTAMAAITGNKVINSGTYHVPSVSPNGQSVVEINGDVTLYVDGDFVFTGQPILKIKSGAKLTVYQNSGDGTAKFTVAGGSVINSDQLPSSLIMYSNTKNGKLSGNADFYGTIYAPSTEMAILGTSGLYGSTIAKTIDIQGTPFFHYDESLGAIKSGIFNINGKAVQQFMVPSSVTLSLQSTN